MIFLAGADVNLVDNDGRSVLYLAVRADHIEATRALIREGAVSIDNSFFP